MEKSYDLAGRGCGMYELAIIGAGAAGLLAAVGAGAAGRESGTASLSGRVALIDGNEEVGRKIYATGNGRCNMLNRLAEPSDYGSGDEAADCEGFVEKVFSVADAAFLESVFRSLGIESAYEEEGRVYPASFQAAGVVEALSWAVENSGCDIFLSSKVKRLEKPASEVFEIKMGDGNCLLARKVLVATGGKGGIAFGSSGDGYKFAASLGHNVVKPIPALARLKVGKAFLQGSVGPEGRKVATPDNSFLSELAGVRTVCEISFIESYIGSPGTEVFGNAACAGEGDAGAECSDGAGAEERVIAVEMGELQFTEEGISGICVFNLSRFLRFRDGILHSVSVNFAPEKDEASVREIIGRRKAELAQRKCKYALRGMLPSKLGDFLLSVSGIDLSKNMKSLTGEEEELMAKLITDMRFTIEGASSWKEAQCTSGGIALEEVDPLTMESRIVPGLYFAGEVLDVDGPCGGYNLTFAFATGYIAGLSAMKK